MKYWNETVLANVKQIACGSIPLDNIADDGELLSQQSQRNSAPAQPAPKQTQDNIEKLQNVLNNLYSKNNELQKLTAENLISIFTDANTHGYYTNAPKGKEQLPLDGSDEQVKLMRKFSVKFQKECKAKGLTFSNTNSVNKNGMRTKSVVAFLSQNKNNGDITNLVKGAGWK